MCALIWEHGGDIILANRQGGGLSVRLELPTGPELGSPDQEEIRSGGGVRKSDLAAPKTDSSDLCEP